jgi:hypothetical protein
MFLNSQNQFIKGRFKFEDLDEVGLEEPEYLKYLLENCDLSPTETAAIEEVLEESESQ